MANDRKKQKEFKKLVKNNDIKSLFLFIQENIDDEDFDFSLLDDKYGISEENFLKLFNENGEVVYNDNYLWIILYTKKLKELIMKIDKNWASHFSPLEIEYINYSLKHPEIDEAFMSMSGDDILNKYFANGTVSEELFSEILFSNDVCKKLLSSKEFKKRFSPLEIKFIERFHRLDENLFNYATNKNITRNDLELIFDGKRLLPKYYKDIIVGELVYEEGYYDVDKYYKYLNGEELVFVYRLQADQDFRSICGSYNINFENFKTYFDIIDNDLKAKKEFITNALNERDFLICSFINSNQYGEYNLQDNEITIIQTLKGNMSPKIKNAFLELLKQKEEILTYDKEKLHKFLGLLSLITVALENSNSKELRKFKGDILIQLMNNPNPEHALNLINDIYTKNNLPDVGKAYLIFKVLHGDYTKFNLSEESMISPVLKSCKSDNERDMIIFSDLIKAAFGSNNRSIRDYLKNIKEGNELFSRDDLDVSKLNSFELNTLKIFCDHLRTLYNNTQAGKEKPKIASNNLLKDLQDLKESFKPNERYSLPDRIVRSFCYYAGFKSFDEAWGYFVSKIDIADKRNRLNSQKVELSGLTLEQGDFVKGIGDLKYLATILQNGSGAKEFLAIGATSDLTPLDTDLTMVTTATKSLDDMISTSRSSFFGPIFFVLKKDNNITVTRDENGNLYSSVSINLEAFSTGEKGHYGIRTGFATSDVDYIVIDSEKVDEILSQTKHIIVTNGFYIPVVDSKTGKLLFDAREYDEMKSKMAGMKYYNDDQFVFSKNLAVDDDIKFIRENIDRNNADATIKKQKIYEILRRKFAELGIELKDYFDLDISLGNVQLIDTGSTGRGTATGITSDFDFIMRIDSNMDENKIKSMIFKAFNIPSSADKMKNIRVTGIKIDDSLPPIDLDISFLKKSESNFYSTDRALKERLEQIKKQDDEKYRDVVANIILAKQVLKNAGAYKPNHAREKAEGGLGGVGIENWILQHGGSFYDAAKSFVDIAGRCNFEEFCNRYKIWDYGMNFYTGEYEEYVSQNMSRAGFEKMKSALEQYLKTVKVIVKDSITYEPTLSTDFDLSVDDSSLKL